MALVPAISLHADADDGGGYHVSGTVEEAGTPDVPVSRRVRLIDRRSGRLVREAFSDASGAYSFTNIRIGPWIVVSFDHTGEYNAVIADAVYGVLP